MMDDKALREKLAKVEALFRRAASPGEKAAAGAAMDRLHGRLGSWDRNPDPEAARPMVELFTGQALSGEARRSSAGAGPSSLIVS